MSRGATVGGDRIKSVDWLRGGAVIEMIFAHSLAFLSPAHDRDAFRASQVVIGGMPAPAFLFAAGFSLALVAARAERKERKEREAGGAGGAAPAARWAWDGRALRSLRRIGVVFAASLLLRHVQWHAFEHPERLAWIDVLSCIGLMLVGTWAVLFALPRGARYAALGGLTAAAFAAAPWVEAPREFGWATTLLNNVREPNTWPLVPWAGYGWLGAIVGLRTGGSGGGDAPRETLFRTLAWVALGGLIVFFVAGPIVRAVDPGVSAWLIANAGDRTWRIAVVTMGLMMVEARRRGPAGPVERWVNLLSRRSLLAYVGHQILLFGWSWFGPFNRFLFRQDWPMTLALTAAVLALTTLACAGWEWIGSRRAARP